jgi:hypothetical protein
VDESTPTAPTDAGQTPEAGEGSKPEPKAEPKTFDEAYVKQLRREAAESRKALGEATTRLQAFEERDKTEGEKLAARVSESEKRASAAESRALRYEIAAAHGLDLDAANFLSGDSREEIEERAKALTKLLEDKSKPATGSFDGGARERPEEKPDPVKAHNALLLGAMGRTPQ